MAEKGKLEIWTSVFSLIECRYTNEEIGQYPENNDRILDAYFEQPYVNLIQLTGDTAKLSRNVWRRVRTEFRPDLGEFKYQDAVHLASAIEADIDLFHTYDGSDLLPLDRKFNCANQKPLRICQPEDPSQLGPLFPAQTTS